MELSGSEWQPEKLSSCEWQPEEGLQTRARVRWALFLGRPAKKCRRRGVVLVLAASFDLRGSCHSQSHPLNLG